MKVCLICGSKIDFTARARKYCSEECRKRVKYENDRAWLKANPGKSVEYSKKWRTENIERVRENGREAYRRKCLAKFEKEENNNG